jgi:hypothetical protein
MPNTRTLLPFLLTSLGLNRYRFSFFASQAISVTFSQAENHEDNSFQGEMLKQNEDRAVCLSKALT